MTLVEDVATEMSMTIKKRQFTNLENGETSTDAQGFHRPNTNPQTEAPSQNIEDDCPDRPEELNTGIRNDGVRTRKNASRRKEFFENLRDEMPSAEVENEVTDPMSVGQASYQKTREGVIIKYKDTGDDEFQCVHCHAHFWLDEANQRTSRTAPIIYTGCCQKRQVQLPEPAKTPDFFEQLLNPNNGRQSLIFRDNIRVYNSMFAFTSMSEKIDKYVNDGSGPYIFKMWASASSDEFDIATRL